MLISVFNKIKWSVPNLFNFISLRGRHVKYGDELRILGLIMLRGKGKIIIGNYVRINSCRDANPIGGDIKTILFVKENGKLTVGNNTGISNTAIFCQSEIAIGENVFIGNSCKIYDSDFHSLDYEDRITGRDKNIGSKPIIIEDGVFIGAHSIVLKGVTIGSKSIVGAGSVVTKDIPAGEIWAGNPARRINKVS